MYVSRGIVNVSKRLQCAHNTTRHPLINVVSFVVVFTGSPLLTVSLFSHLADAEPHRLAMNLQIFRIFIDGNFRLGVKPFNDYAGLELGSGSRMKAQSTQPEVPSV